MDEHGLFNALMMIFSVLIMRAYLAPLRLEEPSRPMLSYLVWGMYAAAQYLAMASGAAHPLLVLSANLCLIMALHAVSCGMGPREALFHTGIFCASWMAAEVITQNLLLAAGAGGQYFFDVGNIISKICVFIMVQLRCRLYSRDSALPLPGRFWAEIMLVPAGSVFIIYGTYCLTCTGGSSVSFTAVSFIMVLINHVAFDVYGKMCAHAFTERQNSIYAQQISSCVRQASEREAAYRQSRALRHDLSARLVALQALIREGRCAEAENEIGRMLDENMPSRQEAVHSGNLALDALINYKYAAALRDCVSMDCKLEVPAQLAFDPTDLCIILGCLLDNALEAVRGLPEGDRRVSLAMRMEKGVLSIRVENPYAGSVRTDRKGQLLTTKDDREAHGIGIASVERTARRYDGLLSVRHDRGLFRAVVILYSR